jgi:hypothetical protein
MCLIVVWCNEVFRLVNNDLRPTHVYLAKSVGTSALSPGKTESRRCRRHPQSALQETCQRAHIIWVIDLRPGPGANWAVHSDG